MLRYTSQQLHVSALIVAALVTVPLSLTLPRRIDRKYCRCYIFKLECQFQLIDVYVCDLCGLEWKLYQGFEMR